LPVSRSQPPQTILNSQSDSSIELSIVMPSLNEEENIAKAIENTLQAFDDYEISGEVVVINDGSTDGTEDVVKKILQNEARVQIVNHDHAQGVGASFWDGVDHSNGKIVSWLPGDNEGDPWEIVRYIKLLQNVDIVIPFVFNKEVRSLPRNMLSATFRFIINATFRVNFNYTNGTVIFRKSVLQELDYRSTSFFFLTDILVRLVNKGYLFAEVPIRLGVRGAGVSKAVSFPSLMQVIRGYIHLLKDCYYLKKFKNKNKEFHSSSATAQRYEK